MKTFYKNTLLLIAVVLFAPLTANADNDPSDPMNTLEGLGFTKCVTPDPDKDNAYNITLTAFTTGSTISETIDVTVAADIVLVLDVSGSMAYGAGENVTSLELNKLYEFRSGNTTRYGKVFQNGDRYYLRYRETNNITFSTTPTGYNNASGWTGYNNVTSMPGVPTGWTAKKSRITLMQEAVKTFVSTVNSKNPSTGDRHRIAIVKFAGGANNDYDMTTDNTNYNGSRTVYNLTDVTSATQCDAIIDGLRAAGATNAGLGMSNAYTILNNAGEDGRSKVTVFFTDGSPGLSSFDASTARAAVNNAYSIKELTTVLKQNGEVVTDENGNPVILKSKVYSVGLLTSETSSNTYDVRRFMHYVSSNYKFQPASTYTFTSNATNSKKLVLVEGTEDEYDYTGSTGGDEPFDDASDPLHYYQLTTDGSGLESIFQNIASSSSNAPTIPLSMKPTDLVAVDVVSNKFKLPDGADASTIQVLVAPFTGIDETGTYTEGQLSRLEHYQFGTPLTYASACDDPEFVKGTPQKDSNGKIIRDGSGNILYEETFAPYATIDPNDDHSITVQGFNYADNWCGYDERTINGVTTLIPHGYELVIIIPIEVDPANPGGASVETNGPGSGIKIYNEDGTIAHEAVFPIPTVTLPNIIICKYGLLNKGESASFLLQKLQDDGMNIDPDFNPYYIIVTAADDDPNTFDFVQVKLQQPGRYRVTETAWGWSYNAYVGGVVAVAAENSADMSNPEVDGDKMKELSSATLTATTTGSDSNGHPYVNRDVSSDTEQTIALPGGNRLSGAVFNFLNTSKEIEKRNYNEAHKRNEFPTVYEREQWSD